MLGGVRAEDLLTRSLKLLQGAIRASGFTQTDVDERIGRRRGYLSHVFQRRVDLKLIDLLRVLQVLEVPADRFFAAVTSEQGTHSSGVLQLIADQLESEVRSPALRTGSDSQLEDRVRQALRSILGQLGQHGALTGSG